MKLSYPHAIQSLRYLYETKKKKKTPRKIENVFSKNVKLVKRRFPHLWQRLQATKNSNHSPQQNQTLTEKDKPIADHIQKTNFLFYLDEDPIVSVRKIIDDWHFYPYDVLFFIGMGLGYLPIEAIKKGIGNPRMVIIENPIREYHALW